MPTFNVVDNVSYSRARLPRVDCDRSSSRYASPSREAVSAMMPAVPVGEPDMRRPSIVQLNVMTVTRNGLCLYRRERGSVDNRAL
jgi:hypothetical protein